MSEPVDKQLRDFLAWEADKRRRGLTLEALHDKVDRLHRAQQQILNDRLEDRSSIARHGRRIKSIERELEQITEASDERPNWRPDPRDTTGNFDVAVIKAQHEAMLDDAKWSRRQQWQVIGTILAALVVAGVTGCVGYAVSRATAPTQHSP